MKIHLFLLGFLIFGLVNYSHGQSTGITPNQGSLSIMDLSVIPVNSNTLMQNQQDSTRLQLMFKINNKASALKAVYLFGTLPDTGDVMISEAVFSKQGNSTFVQCGDIQKEVIGYNVSVVITLSKQQSAQFKCLTVYVQKPNGHISNKLYFKKH